MHLQGYEPCALPLSYPAPNDRFVSCQWRKPDASACLQDLPGHHPLSSFHRTRKKRIMGVISDTTRKIKVFGLVLIIGIGGLYAYTKWDTSKDRTATIVVTLKPAKEKRQVLGSAYSYINGAERASRPLTDQDNKYEDSFWVRPGEKVRLWAYLYFGEGTLTCTILFDGVVAEGPKVSSTGFESTCEVSATA